MTASIIIPTYNYGRFIGEAIQSVLDQPGINEISEIWVIDDGSTDNTMSVLQPFINNGIIKYHYQVNQGKAAATQKGIELATGEVIFNLDSDDYFLPRKISQTLALFKADISLVHVGSPAMIHWDNNEQADKPEPIPVRLLGKRLDGEKILRYYFENKLLYGGGSTFAARAWALKQVHWNRAVDMYTDEWMMIEMLLKGDSYLLPEPLSVWRVHGSNYSGTSAPGNLLKKHDRLEKSSAAIKRLLQQHQYPRWLIKAYKLKHEVRKMVWLEERNQKSARDIARFFFKGILSGNSLQVLRKYHAFHRLAPQWLKKLKP
jgi:glycosyltransferase involved in cell wall biosynthesis